MKQWVLIQLRRERKISQSDLAKILKVDPSTYFNKESGRTLFNLKEAFIISSMFGLPIDEIFLHDDSTANRI